IKKTPPRGWGQVRDRIWNEGDVPAGGEGNARHTEPTLGQGFGSRTRDVSLPGASYGHLHGNGAANWRPRHLVSDDGSGCVSGPNARFIPRSTLAWIRALPA